MIGTPQVDWLRSRRRDVSWRERASANSGLSIEVSNRARSQDDARPKRKRKASGKSSSALVQREVGCQCQKQQRYLHVKCRIVEISRGIGKKHHSSGEEHHGKAGMSPYFERTSMRHPKTQRVQVFEND